MTEATCSSKTAMTTPALYLACELGSTTWVLAFTTAPAQRPRLRRITAGDVDALTREITAAKQRFGLAIDAAVHSCYEAGRDGFWLHRWLEARTIANVVVDSSSIEVNRRARRAKTDRLDAGRLLTLLLRWRGGEARVILAIRLEPRYVCLHRSTARRLSQAAMGGSASPIDADVVRESTNGSAIKASSPVRRTGTWAGAPAARQPVASVRDPAHVCLPSLRAVSELVLDDAQERNVLGDPLLRGIETRDPAAGIRVLHVP